MIIYVLNKAKKSISSRYIFTIEGTTVIIKYANKNATIYKLKEGKNVISIELKITMDDIVTKIKNLWRVEEKLDSKTCNII